MIMNDLNKILVIKHAMIVVLIFVLQINAFSTHIIDLKNGDLVSIQDSLLDISPKYISLWKQLNKTSWPALIPFEAKFSFKSNSYNTIVIEWPDNKIEKIDALLMNSKNEICTQIHFKDTEGFHSNFGIKNQVLSFSPKVIGEIYTVKYTIVSHQLIYPFCWMMSLDNFSERFNNENSWYGLLLGIVFMVLLLNVFMFINSQNKIFLYYAFYAFCFGLFQLAYTGLGFQWVWSELYLWNRISILVCSFLLVSSQFIYLYYYVKNIQPIASIYIYSIILLRFILLIMTVYIPSFSQWYPLFDTLTIAYQLYLMFKSRLLSLFHGKLYLISISILEFSYLIFISSYFQLIGASFYTYNAIAFGGIVELMIGMFAIALRFKYLILQKQDLQKQEINSLKLNADLKEQLFQETKEKQRIQIEINKELR